MISKVSSEGWAVYIEGALKPRAFVLTKEWLTAHRDLLHNIYKKARKLTLLLRNKPPAFVWEDWESLYRSRYASSLANSLPPEDRLVFFAEMFKRAYVEGRYAPKIDVDAMRFRTPVGLQYIPEREIIQSLLQADARLESMLSSLIEYENKLDLGIW